MISDAIRRQVMERDGGFCQLLHRRPVPATEVAHVKHQGHGGDVPDSPVNQPGNLIASCADCHRKLHGTGIPYQIVRFNPDAGILALIDREGRLVAEDLLWWYVKRDAGEVLEAAQEVERLAASVRAAQWRMGELLSCLKEHGEILHDATQGDVFSVGLEAGLSSAEVKRLIRAHRWAADMELDCAALDPAIVDRLRRVPDEELDEVFAEAHALSRPDLYRLLNDRYGSARQKTYRVFAAAYREVKAATEDEVEYAPGEVVVRGGSVIAGAAKEASDA